MIKTLEEVRQNIRIGRISVKAGKAYIKRYNLKPADTKQKKPL